ncbi:MAG: transketolase [Chlorobi bacterium]|nr:transketolase [Chlorobiota bacterium]
MKNNVLDEKSVSVIRGLIMDGTRKANSGHPGGAMSSADFAFVLFKDFLKFDPEDPGWFNRDRFILSAGHETMLLYSLLVLQGYLPAEQLQQFRQYGSLTPGHPEHTLTPGVEATTGPLGQGVGMAVGMAVAEAMLAAHLGSDIVDHYTYVLAGDGDLQEPVALGSAAIAGHFGLNKLILYYDRNAVQISGTVNRADNTDFEKLFQSFGWQVIRINGHNHGEIRKAIVLARENTSQPTLIIGKTTMAKGSATKEGSPSTHGSPLSPEEIRNSKIKLGLPPDEEFYLPEDVIRNFSERFDEMRAQVTGWNRQLEIKLLQNADFDKLWQSATNPDTGNLELPLFSPDKPMATRAASGKILEALAGQLAFFAGGSADLEPSNATADFAKRAKDFTKDHRKGRNLPFGVREFPMGAILNGMALHGGIIPFGATFLVFSDYEKAAMRLTALQNLRVLHIFTHDSFYVGEDGPTHQPIEHIAALRIIPGLLVFRPADANETAEAYKFALNEKERPSALVLTRQNVPVIDRSAYPSAGNVKKGAYILSGDENITPDIILIATGSEVHLALDVAKLLKGYEVRVVSMPSRELFEEQPEEYRRKVIPPEVKKRVTIEAGTTYGWEKYAGPEGLTYGLDHFGASAPAEVLKDVFGFTPEKLLEKIKCHFDLT